MKVYDAASIRNVALVGHSSSGKTQLAAAILSDAGMVNRFGKVDDGTTVTDFDEEEVARKHTLSSSLAFVEWQKTKINLIDTPGIGNFLSDACAALQVVDAAVVVVDAVAGVMVQTEKVWAVADELALPRMVVVNRLDRERASLERTLQSLREVCHRTVIPDSAADWRGEIVQGRRRSRSPGRRSSFQPDESGTFATAAMSRGDDGRGRGGARSADRNGRGSRRNADGAVLRGGHADRRRADRRPSQRDGGRQAVPAGLHLGAAEHRRAAAARRGRRLSPVSCRPAVQGHRQGRGERRARRQRKGSGRGVRLEDHCRSVCRTDHDVPRRLRRAQVRFHRAEQDQGRRRAPRQPDAAAGQDADDGAGNQGRAISAPSRS